jgi:predicted MPP superfamily phosphohydrolase
LRYLRAGGASVTLNCGYGHGFDLLLSGHTHGGQICLPGSIPITLSSVLPRRFGSGAWKYHDMIGYTSVGVGSSIVAVRIMPSRNHTSSSPMLLINW